MSVPDYIGPGLKVLFVGFNPGLASGTKGHHYAGANNSFWRLLDDSGLAPGLSARDDHRILEHGMGLTNVVSRTTRAASEVTKHEYRQGAALLLTTIETYRPAIACYTGKGAYCWASGQREVEFGLQQRPISPPTVDYVVPCPSGRSAIRYSEKLEHYRQLRALIATMA